MSKGLEALNNMNVLQITTKEQPPKFIRLSDVFKEEYKTIEKELKALEIIKYKQVDIHNFLNSKTCEQYNGFIHWLGYKGNLTQEEYDLLKEELE